SDPASSRRPPSCSTEVILTERPVAAPLMIFLTASTLRIGGRLTVAASPRTQTDGSLHTMTVLIAHCMGLVPSYGGAAPGVRAPASRMATSPIRLTSIGLAAQVRSPYAQPRRVEGRRGDEMEECRSVGDHQQDRRGDEPGTPAIQERRRVIRSRDR